MTPSIPQPTKKMYWRVMARFSLTNDKGSVVRNLVIKKLENHGIRNLARTGTWESRACEIGPATKILTEVMRELSQISRNANRGTGDPYLNHLWIYIDHIFKSPDKVP